MRDDGGMPRAAAIVINYNYGRYLAECLDSIDAQTHPDVRIIVVDDASTDDSTDVIKSFLERTRREVAVIAKPENRGPAHSYNLALRQLTDADDYVAIIDADDTWRPGKFSAQIDALNAAGAGVVVSYGHVDVYDEATGDTTPDEPIVVPPGGELERLLSHGAFVPLNSAMLRGSAVRTLKPLDERMRVCDLQLWMQLARLGRFQYTPVDVGVARVHGTSMRSSETLTGDRLLITARVCTTRTERRAARSRGTALLRTAALGQRRTPVKAYALYGWRARDARAALYLGLSLLPARWLARAAGRRGPGTG